MSKATLLIVEDDPLQRRLIKENLEAEDYVVFDVSTGKEALDIMKDFPVDIAMVGRRLPKRCLEFS